MTRILGSSYQSLNTEALKLRQLGVLEKDADSIWSLVPGADPAMFGIEVINSDLAASTPPQPESPRTLENEFRDLLRNVGIKKAVEAITDIYFAGDDIWDIRWLYRVLSDDARGFVTEGQCKLIMGYWAITNGMPYEHEDFFED